MASSNAWRVLSTGESDEVVLACDFPTAIRPEAQFSDFVPLLRPAVTVWESAMPDPGAETGWSAEEYLDSWLEPLRESGVRVSGVLGFCAGSVFAAGVARRVAELQSGPVPLVVIDPERPTSEALYIHYHRGIEIFGTALEQADVDEMIGAGRELLARDDDLRTFGPALSELYQRVADGALERIGLNQKRRAELISIFTSFVDWVVAAERLDPTEEWAGATCVSSESHAAQPIEAKQRITLGVDHDRMLADADVARTVVDSLQLGARR